MAFTAVRLDERLWFPDPRLAISRGQWDGLVAVGGDLSPERLLLAYRSGLFPWTVNPVTWWSPDPRGVFEVGTMHHSRSLRQTLRRAPYQVTCDRAFEAVVRACAEAPRPGAWITEEFVAAYAALHRLGHAHSVECWRGGDVVGGVYGVAVGGLFAGESMFHRADDASKVALAHLHQHLKERGFVLFDVQMVTAATAVLGAHEISRHEYLRRLEDAVARACEFRTDGVGPS
ncbi:MAG: leucyl/phenylalanyl-tRNA--protein transferase [Verrucomicrobiales bacterium]|nr:leucyl/phenylalanyl-tRNA--protein transferase [Verrucomicrobiales bacterium]